MLPRLNPSSVLLVLVSCAASLTACSASDATPPPVDGNGQSAAQPAADDSAVGGSASAEDTQGSTNSNSAGGASSGSPTDPGAATNTSNGSTTGSNPPPSGTAGSGSPAGTTPGTSVPAPEDQGVIVEEDQEFIVDAPMADVMDEADCDNILEVTYRDFTTEHADFEMQFQGDVVRLGLIEDTLDSEGKPIFKDSIGCPQDNDIPQTCNTGYTPDTEAITSAETFNQWYRTVDGVNMEFQKELELTETSAGSGVYVFESDMFFPIGDDEGFGKTPSTAFANFLFTTEIHLLFTYIEGQTFTFRGDDDLWIFVNDKLALDLGSMHNVEEGTIDFDAQAADLGITPRGLYRMDVFHAERHTFASNFRIQTNIGCFRPNPARVR